MHMYVTCARISVYLFFLECGTAYAKESGRDDASGQAGKDSTDAVHRILRIKSKLAQARGDQAEDAPEPHPSQAAQKILLRSMCREASDAMERKIYSVCPQQLLRPSTI